MLTDAEAEAKKEAEKAAKKPVIDPSRYSLDNVPIGGFGGGRVDQLPGLGTPAGQPSSGPVMQGPNGLGYFEVDPQKVFDQETALISQRQSVETARQRVLELEAEGTATAAEISAAKTAAQLAERGYISLQQKLAEAQQGTWKKMEDTAKKFANGMDGIGAALDSDFGLSDGLPGLAENLTKFIANLAAAPLLGQLSAIKTAAGDEGSGVVGMLASNGAFGDRFLPNKTGTTTQADNSQAATAGPLLSGNPNVNAMLALAQSSSGKTAYAPASDLINGLADCSGSISDLYEVLTTGKASPARMFTTTNFASDAEAAKLGFLPGYMPGALNVGVNPYPGQSGHMAATLPNGVNFEGGGGTGGGAQYGGSAAGAQDPQFEKHYYLPTGATPGVPASGPSAISMSGPSFPIPLPVTIVGGLPGGGGPISIPGASPGLAEPGLPGPVLPGIPAATPNAIGPAPLGGGLGPPTFSPLTPGQLTNPGLTSPTPIGGGAGSGAGIPGLGPVPQGLTPPGVPGNPIGPSLMPGQAPGPVPGAGAGMSTGIGGIPLAALQGAASGLDMLAPGAGAAANLGIQLANRTIGYAGQQAGNLVSGLFETFTLSGSKGSIDPMKSLPGRLLAGIAGARPSLPNTSGGGVQKPQEQQQNPQQNQGGGPMVNIEQVNQAPGQEPSSVANEVASQVRSAELSTGYFRR